MANNRSLLDPAQKQQLTEMGFDWNPSDTAWEAMFAQLTAFKNEHGHTDVPQRSGRYKNSHAGFTTNARRKNWPPDNGRKSEASR